MLSLIVLEKCLIEALPLRRGRIIVRENKDHNKLFNGVIIRSTTYNNMYEVEALDTLAELPASKWDVRA